MGYTRDTTKQHINTHEQTTQHNITTYTTTQNKTTHSKLNAHYCVVHYITYKMNYKHIAITYNTQHNIAHHTIN